MGNQYKLALNMFSSQILIQLSLSSSSNSSSKGGLLTTTLLHYLAMTVHSAAACAQSHDNAAFIRIVNTLILPFPRQPSRCVTSVDLLCSALCYTYINYFAKALLILVIQTLVPVDHLRACNSYCSLPLSLKLAN